ncbi:unnamed protein product [Aureobasidium pullulans]|nr:unnamed protein product [Aureobasidium pullulans]
MAADFWKEGQEERARQNNTIYAKQNADLFINRHRVTLKKRYGLLITQQSTFYHRLQPTYYSTNH